MPEELLTSYVEVAPRRELRRHLACVWFERPRPDGAPYRTRVLPDGYVDLIFGRSLWVRGPDTRAHGLSYGTEASFVGLRFRTGAAREVLGVPLTELVDRRVFLRDLWGEPADELAESLAGLAPPAVAARMEAAVLSRLSATDALVDGVVGLLAKEARVSTASIADRLGVSQRQLLRRMRDALGYGPKTLQRILRLQRFLRLASTTGAGLAELAYAAGYADQPHLSRECRRLTGRPPSALVR